MTPTITLPAYQPDAEGFTPYIATFKINNLDDAAEFYCGIADGWGALSPTLKSIAFANQLATTPCPSPAQPSGTPSLSPTSTESHTKRRLQGSSASSSTPAAAASTSLTTA